MPLLKAWNHQLIDDREKTYLTAAVATGGTTLTVVAVNADVGADSLWADNTYIIVGEIGSPNAEVLQMNGAASDGTSLTIDQLGAGGARFAHAIGEPVYRIDYNRVEFNRNTTDSTSGVTVLATQLIQPDDEYTRYEDTTSTTGYGFVRFNNQASATFSSYSDGVNYEAGGTRSSADPRTLWRLRKRVRRFLKEPSQDKLTDEMIDEALNDKQRDVAHARLWSFYEGERSFSAVADQFAYDIPATVQKVHEANFETQPLVFVPRTKWKLLHFDTDQKSDTVTHFSVWNRQVLLWPRPSSAAGTTTINVIGGISATATSVTVASSASFSRGDYYRFIIDSEVIYATASTSTTFTGLLRGREDTTAATHANGATITERDIVYSCHVEPADMINTQDRTEISEPDVLAYGAALDLAPFVDREHLMADLKDKYERGIKDLENKYSSKQSSQFGRVKEAGLETVADTASHLNPNLYPRSINA